MNTTKTKLCARKPKKNTKVITLSKRRLLLTQARRPRNRRAQCQQKLGLARNSQPLTNEEESGCIKSSSLRYENANPFNEEDS